MLPTVPGTLTNVTPLSDVPIIPNATSIQLLLRLPIKKESLLRCGWCTTPHQAIKENMQLQRRTKMLQTCIIFSVVIFSAGCCECYRLFVFHGTGCCALVSSRLQAGHLYVWKICRLSTVNSRRLFCSTSVRRNDAQCMHLSRAQKYITNKYQLYNFKIMKGG